MKNKFTNSSILDAIPSLCFSVNDYFALPIADSKTKYAVIHCGKIIKTCRNSDYALKYIHRVTKKDLK